MLSEGYEGMDYMALVDSPAHMKSFEFFNKNEKVKYHFNEEKRIVTGVAIAVDLPIYRNDNTLGEHYVVFNKQETEKIWERMMRSNYMHNVNEMHDSNKAIKGITYLHSYPVDKARGVNPPESLKSQNLKDGSIIVYYKVDDDKAWNDIKSGKHIGFSIEGWFDKANIKTKNKNTKMKKTETKSFFEKVFGTKSKFAEAETVDGVTVVWEGELETGIELKVKTDEGEVLAPEGSHAIIDGEESKTIIVDGNGMITDIETTVGEEEISDEDLAEILSKIRKEFKAEIKEVSDKVTTVTGENAKLKTQLEAVCNELDKSDKKKFNQSSASNWRTLLKK